MKSNIKSKILASTLLAIGFLIGASALSALAGWTAAPAGGPPNCPTNLVPTDPNYRDGCFAPINVGGALQTKNGALVVNFLGALSDIGLRVVGSVKILDGNVVAGQTKVLTDVNGTGVGTWQTPVGGAGGGPVFLATKQYLIGNLTGIPNLSGGGNGDCAPFPPYWKCGQGVNSSWLSIDVSPYVPAGTKAIIVDGILYSTGDSGIGLYSKPNNTVSDSNADIVLGTGSNSQTGANTGWVSGRAIIPIGSNGTFLWKNFGPVAGDGNGGINGVTLLRLVGYY